MRRRDFIAGLGSAAAWPLVGQAQQGALPMVGFITLGSIEGYGRYLPAFRAGLAESSYIEGRNVGIEYQWLGTQTDRFSELVAELIRRRPAVIVVPVHGALALVAKAMTATIPIVFGSPEDPVKLGLVASLARPGGNVTGMNFFTFEATLKRMDLLAKLVPKAARIAVLANPTPHHLCVDVRMSLSASVAPETIGARMTSSGRAPPSSDSTERRRRTS
jgi:putative ABC transport system substrate-binding protein